MDCGGTNAINYFCKDNRKNSHDLATHGLPQKLVTDNGATFTSSEFHQFTEKNGIKHVTSAPYHPSTNGLAERAVQTFKRAIE